MFDSTCASEIRTRIAALRADSPRGWGKMTAPQAVAHLCVGMECALGDCKPPQLFIGKLIGPLAKRFVLGSDGAMAKNAPTSPAFMITGERDLERERTRLLGLLDRFTNGGPGVCTNHPHAFFGRLTPDEWAVLQYKHLDHHLRQFGV